MKYFSSHTAVVRTTSWYSGSGNVTPLFFPFLCIQMRERKCHVHEWPFDPFDTRGSCMGNKSSLWSPYSMPENAEPMPWTRAADARSERVILIPFQARPCISRMSLSVRQSVCPSTRPSIRLSVGMSVHLYVRSSVIRMSVRPWPLRKIKKKQINRFDPK